MMDMKPVELLVLYSGTMQCINGGKDEHEHWVVVLTDTENSTSDTIAVCHDEVKGRLVLKALLEYYGKHGYVAKEVYNSDPQAN